MAQAVHLAAVMHGMANIRPHRRVWVLMVALSSLGAGGGVASAVPKPPPITQKPGVEGRAVYLTRHSTSSLLVVSGG